MFVHGVEHVKADLGRRITETAVAFWLSWQQRLVLTEFFLIWFFVLRLLRFSSVDPLWFFRLQGPLSRLFFECIGVLSKQVLSRPMLDTYTGNDGLRQKLAHRFL